MIDWKRVPWSLWAYAVITLLATAWVEVRIHGHMAVLVVVLYPAIMLAWVCVLFRGIRWIWFGTIVLLILSYALDLVSGSLLSWGNAIDVIQLILLLLPITRRFFSKEPTPAFVDPA